MKLILLSWAFLFPFVGFSQCKALRKKTDKLSSTIEVMTDATEPAVVVRQIRADKSAYYLSLTAPGQAKGERKGVLLLLSDGSRMEWPDESVNTSFASLHPRWDSNITARAFIELTAEQLERLQKNRITDYKLYVYNWQLKERFGLTLQKQTECLISTNPDDVREQ